MSTPASFTSGAAPGALPVLGHAGQLLRDPLTFLASLPAHGDLVSIRLGPRTAYVPCHPELLHRVLTDDRTFDKGGPFYERARDLGGDGLVTCPHTRHRRQRRLVQPAFHKGPMAGHARVMEQEVIALVDGWHEGHTFDAFPTFHRLALRTLTRTMFAAQVDDETAAAVQRAHDIVIDGFVRHMVTPSALRRLPTPGRRRYERALADLTRTVDSVVADYRRNRPTSGDFLSLLLAARDEDGSGPSARELRDQVVSLMTAGSETTPAALAWVFHLLAAHPEAELRLYAEVDAVLAGRPARFADLDALSYTHRLVKEALRLFPPGWMFTRTTTSMITVAGLQLPPGTDVVFTPCAVQRRPDVYDQPQRFLPDRWLPERAATLPRGAFTAFGHGARKCIGDSYSTAETVLTLATIATKWHLAPQPGSDLRPVALSSVLRPRRLRLRVTARQPLGGRLGRTGARPG